MRKPDSNGSSEHVLKRRSTFHRHRALCYLPAARSAFDDDVILVGSFIDGGIQIGRDVLESVYVDTAWNECQVPLQQKVSFGGAFMTTRYYTHSLPIRDRRKEVTYSRKGDTGIFVLDIGCYSIVVILGVDDEDRRRVGITKSGLERCYALELRDIVGWRVCHVC